MSADLAKGKVKSFQRSDLSHERPSIGDSRVSTANTYKLATAPVSGDARSGVTASCPA